MCRGARSRSNSNRFDPTEDFDRGAIYSKIVRQAIIDFQLDRYPESRRLADEALTLYRALGDQHGISSAFAMLGWIAVAQGQLEEAISFMQESLALRRALGHHAHIAGALRNLGAALISLGRFDEALSALEESVTTYDDLGASGELDLPVRAALPLRPAPAALRHSVDILGLNPCELSLDAPAL
jgi:tetratricopeptide (TPR) repeat protein